ncbi:MAG: AAA family ATPase [Acaryochloridaceae cyanobacterium RU_4_10]|nr:AAA family ATPase [Acaryochloridaceae cyanobacterium RU_4_10]
MVGYQTERSRLINWVEAHLQHPSPSMMVIQGEAGIGKTQLMNALLLWIQAQGISYAIGSGDAIERLTPYYPWRQILRQLLQLDDLADPQTRRSSISQSLQLPAELSPLTSLLNPILGVNFPETALIQDMSPSVHAENTRFILLEILRRCCETHQPIIFLETLNGWTLPLGARSWRSASSLFPSSLS